MRSVSTTSARAVVAAALAAMGACAPAPEDHHHLPDQADARPPDPPDATVHLPRAKCEPGDPPCAGGSTCTNFGSFGGQVCAEGCQQSTDCGDGLLCVSFNGKGVCATPEWGGAAGIYPEALCRDENACGRRYDDNETLCDVNVNQCVAALTESQRRQWLNALAACDQYTNCNDYFSCIGASAVTWCW
jgi:hypothetical protein